MNPTTSSPSMSPPPPGGSCSRTLLIPVEDNEVSFFFFCIIISSKSPLHVQPLVFASAHTHLFLLTRPASPPSGGRWPTCTGQVKRDDEDDEERKGTRAPPPHKKLLPSFPGDTLLFLRIIPEPPAPTACAFSAPFGSASKLEAGRHLDAVRSAIAARFAPLADAAGARYTLATVTTADASCETIGGLICERATGVGLVVIAAHNKKGALARFCLGSVTQHCVAHSPATVLVMREDGFR